MKLRLSKRPISLLLILAAILAVGFAAWKLRTWRGAGPNSQQRLPAPDQNERQQDPGLAPFLPGARSANQTAPIRSGVDPRSISEYVSFLETIYRQRGYRQATFDPQQPAKAPAIPPGVAKLYWLGESAELHLISAFGVDADPHSGSPAAQAETCVTLVRQGDQGGVQWESFRFDPGSSGQDVLPAGGNSAESLSGVDPPGIPIHPGLTRVLGLGHHSGGQGRQQTGSLASYQSSEPSGSLIDWYSRRMEEQGWRLSPLETEGAQQVNERALCFRRGQQLCLLMIARDQNCQCTSLLISLH